MLEHQAPSELLHHTFSGLDAPGICIRPSLLAKRYLLLQSKARSNLQDVLTSEIGLELPLPQEVRALGDHALLWLTPAEWLLETPAKDAQSLQLAITGALVGSLAAVNDISDAFVCCEVSGDCAPQVLMSGCSLDLNTHAFPAGRVARTALADIPVIIWKPAPSECFRCLVDRSFACHFGDWLADAIRG